MPGRGRRRGRGANNYSYKYVPNNVVPTVTTGFRHPQNLFYSGQAGSGVNNNNNASSGHHGINDNFGYNGGYVGEDSESAGEEENLETGVQVKTVQFVWQVKNFRQVVRKESLIREQVLEREITDPNGVKSKWQFYLDCDETFVIFNVKLLKIDSDSEPGSEEVRHENHVNIGSFRVNPNAEIWESEPGSNLSWKQFVAKTWNPPADGILRIYIILKIFSVTQMKERMSPESRLQAFHQLSKDKCANILKTLENDQATSDVRIMARDGVSYPAHRIILSKASTVFETMFQTDMVEKRSGVIRCDDLSGKCIKVLIHYIYTGTLADDWATPGIIEEVTYSAGKYQLKGLLQFLDESLGSFAKPESAPKLLALANQLFLKKAEKELMEVFKRSTSSVEDLMDAMKVMRG